jgi:DNA-binding response OmpR family regulator
MPTRPITVKMKGWENKLCIASATYHFLEYSFMAKILVVDDDINIRVAMKITLEGYDIMLAEDGQQAIALVDWERPDLILMDIMMPGMDGITAAETILQRHNVPIIFISGLADKVSVPVGLSRFAPIQKPFDPMELRSKIGFTLMNSIIQRTPSYPQRFKAS